MNETKLSAFGITIEDIAAILNYPSLDKLFDEKNPNALADIREKFAKTEQDLERVIRQGTNEDAAKAEKAISAIKITLEFLVKIEELKREVG
jgi:hypothetical protein